MATKTAGHARPLRFQWLARSVGCGPCRSLAAQLLVDLVDRPAARLDRDQPERDGAEQVPGRKIEKARDQRRLGRRRLDVVRRAGDQRQPGGAYELAEIADP